MIDVPSSPLGFRIRRFFECRRSLPGLSLTALVLAQSGFASNRQKFNFVVGVDGDFKAAVSAASSAASSGKRFYIFFPDGQYDIGSLTGNSNQMTTFTTPNVSLIGQSADNTVVYNKSVNEGISITATLFLSNAHDTYLQDLTLFNKAVYGNTAQYGVTGRHVVVMEQSDKIIYKNVKLKSTQDTYYTKGTRTYWEGGEIDGTTDFICGGGDVYFNQVLLWVMKVSAITASQSNSAWGYVFKGCTVDGTVSGFDLGRSWADARTVFINTTMNKLPSPAGWGNPMNSVPKVFAEYKSVTSTGAAVDLSSRRTSYSLSGTTVTLKPVLTDAQAATYTLAAVLGGSDGWRPETATAQVAPPVVSQSGTMLDWADNSNVLCWVIFKNSKYLANVTANSYDCSALSKGDTVTIRAANSMGGLGVASNRWVIGATTAVRDPREIGILQQYNSSNKILRITGGQPGELSISLFTLNGALVFFANIELPAKDQGVDVSLHSVKSGTYFLKYGKGNVAWTNILEIW